MGSKEGNFRYERPEEGTKTDPQLFAIFGAGVIGNMYGAHQTTSGMHIGAFADTNPDTHTAHVHLREAEAFSSVGELLERYGEVLMGALVIVPSHAKPEVMKESIDAGGSGSR